MTKRKGPLTGIKIVEFAGIGPAPFAAMLLADMGADIIRIDRPGGYPAIDPTLNFEAMGNAGVMNRSRPMVRLNLKSDHDKAKVLKLVAKADALIEGYRPGTMERLGLGPEVCHAHNPRLVYARMTGWGQSGPLAQRAGHDLNYIGLSGALSLFGQGQKPPKALPPLIGDMGGGGLMMALGLLAAVICARQSGQGQVVDAAIVDGSASLYALLSGLHALGAHSLDAGHNVLDGGKWFYRTYECKDGKFIAVGAIEPQFRKILLETLGLEITPAYFSQSEPDNAAIGGRLETLFLTRTREEWASLFEATDACVTPVLTMAEAPNHLHAVARQAFILQDGVTQPSPAPRFSLTPSSVQMSAAEAAEENLSALERWGIM